MLAPPHVHVLVSFQVFKARIMYFANICSRQLPTWATTLCRNPQTMNIMSGTGVLTSIYMLYAQRETIFLALKKTLGGVVCRVFLSWASGPTPYIGPDHHTFVSHLGIFSVILTVDSRGVDTPHIPRQCVLCIPNQTSEIPDSVLLCRGSCLVNLLYLYVAVSWFTSARPS